MKLAKKGETNKPDGALGILSKTTFPCSQIKKMP